MDLRHPLKRQRVAAPSSGKAARGLVVVYPCSAKYNPRGHEYMTQSELARRLAALKNDDFAGEFDASRTYAGPLYFVPTDTLGSIRLAHELGIRGEQHLFGGVVPFPFAATKTITHPLPGDDAQAPDGWSSGFAQRVHEVVLPGFSAFTLPDARSAGARMLQQGSVRIKIPSGSGGLGQSVITDMEELDAQLQSIDAEEVMRDGLVFEQNLTDVVTHSVGQVRVAGLLVTYYGTQRLTASNRGQEVYGGSDLVVVRGDFDALLRLQLPDDVTTSIAQARTYHEAAMTSFVGMFASRCNYDIARGVDDHGQRRSGVLEQSWRIGGASGAEIVALEAFQADPTLAVVCASTTEIYGENPELPADATVYFQGVDARAGPLTKYARLKPYANT